MAAETAIIYNGKRIIPAPRVAFQKNYTRSADQSIVGTELQVTLTGQLVGCKGWDFSSGDPEFYTGNDYPADGSSSCNRFESLVQMQDKMRNELFAKDQDYKWFEIIGCNGLIDKWLGRVVSVSFDEGQWVNIVNYTVVLELQQGDTQSDHESNTDYNETWAINFDEENGGIYTLEHTISCTSKEFYDTTPGEGLIDGWDLSKQWVEDRLSGTDYTGSAPTNIKNSYIFSGGFNLSGYSAYDYTVQRQIDEFGGIYSVTETWTLAKDPVFRQWNVVFTQPRDDYATVSVDGTFSSFLNRTSTAEPDNGDAALTAFNTWESGGNPYSIANSFYTSRGGYDTLGDCPVNKSVTITEESRGDGSDAYGEQSRVVQFSFEFSDSDNTAETSITKLLTKSLLENCENRVTVSGSIQGHRCSDTTKIENARTAYESVNCSTEANSIYSEGGTLVLVNSSYSENETTGVVEFSCEYTDKLDANSQLKTERKTVSWSCNDFTGIQTTGDTVDTIGSGKTTYSIEGNIKALCSDITPTAPATGSYNTSDFGSSGNMYLRQRSVTTNDTDNTVEWSYQWDNDGEATVSISTDEKIGPDNCGEKELTLTLSSQGKGCNSEERLTSARTGLSNITVSNYVDSGYCKVSSQESTNYTDGSIQRVYTYTTECDYTVDVTTTESYDNNECDKIRLEVEGTIKGRCFVSGKTALEVAEDALSASYTSSSYGSGKCLLSSSIRKNSKTGTVTFNYVYSTCDNLSYEHQQTITETSNEQNCCDSISISGTITPYCRDDKSQIQIGNEALTTLSRDFSTTAGSYIDNPTLTKTSVTRNQNNGQIQYTYEYRSCTTSFTGAIQESINITREHPGDVVAIVPILGRTCGPLIQNKNTKTVEKCSVAIDITYDASCGSLSQPSTTSSEVDAILSNAACCTGANNVYTERDVESWNPRTGRYTRNVTYICECC